MAKKEEFELEFDLEKELGFDPKEFLGDEPDDTEIDLSQETEAVSEEEVEYEQMEYEVPSDEELDELLDPDFLASLGISLDDESDDSVAEEPEVLPEEDPLPDLMEEEEIPEVPAQVDFSEPVEEDFAPLSEDEEILVPVDVNDAYVPAAEPAFEVEPELGEEFMTAFEQEFPSEEKSVVNQAAAVPDAQEQTSVQKPNSSANPRRRKKLSKERIIKEVYLPPIIAGLALILIITFISGAISRAVKAKQDQENALAASNEASSSALQQEAEMLMAEAEALAQVYNYEAAIAKLDSFSGEISKFQGMMDMYNTYTQAKDKVVAFEDFASIPNLSFHGLIADPSRAFIDETFGKSYNTNYVTIDEFSKILQQLYDKGYVLVNFNSFIVETTGEDGKVTYSTQPLYLPEGKKPLMLTQTLVNYEVFTIDSDGDMEADKGGDGFASKLVVDVNGNILNEYVDADGNTVTGAYDLVPILNDFLEQHPDFSYRGAKATLAVTGEDGVFGYRIMHSVKDKKGEDYYNQQVEGAKKIAQALRDDGYIIGCYTYSNISYGELSATKIQADLDMWKKEVVPVIGKVDLLVYAKSSDISANEGYANNNKYNVLYQEGFRYFVSSANVPWAEVTNEYVRQSRIMVTGGNMKNTPSTYTNYFDAASVLNELRGG